MASTADQILEENGEEGGDPEVQVRQLGGWFLWPGVGWGGWEGGAGMSQGAVLVSRSPRQNLKEQITYTSRLEAKGKPIIHQNLQGGFSVPHLPWVSLTGSFERLWKQDRLVCTDGTGGPGLGLFSGQADGTMHRPWYLTSSFLALPVFYLERHERGHLGVSVG